MGWSRGCGPRKASSSLAGHTLTAAADLFRPSETVDVEFFIRRLDGLRSRRTTWDSHWREIAERIYPHADDFPGSRRNLYGGGERRTEHVYDSTAARALQKLAAALESLLIPRNQKWHRLRASDPRLNQDAEVKEWFEQATRVLFEVRNAPRANYYGQAHEGFLSLGAFGNFCMFIDGRPRGGISYQSCHIGQIYIETDAERRVVAVYRVFPLSASAAFKKWGAAAGPKVLQALEKSPAQEFEYLHVVTPRGDADPEALDSRRMPFLGLYIGLEDRVLVERGGYFELPYLYARWSVGPNESHGRSPAMMVLPEVKSLNQMKRDHLRCSHKAADPPLLIHDDGVIGVGRQREIYLKPAGLNYGGVSSEGRPLIQPLLSGTRPDQMVEIMEQEREAINDAFLVTLFRILVEDPNARTATEVLQRMQEKGELLAPTIGRQQSELLGPQIQRELALLIDQGALPPLPDALLEARGGYEIEYVSPATQFQRASELVGYQRTFELAAPFIELDPTNIEKFDFEAVVELGAEIQGVPSKLLRTREAFAEIAAAKREALAAAAMPEQLATGAAAAKDGAQAVATLQEGEARAAA
jgi:hypothetical protein